MKKLFFVLLITLLLKTGAYAQENNMINFKILSIDQALAQEIKDKNNFSTGSPVAIKRLKLVVVSYWGFDKKQHSGKLIVLDAVAEEVRNIFMELFEQKFLFNKISLITNYNGDDNASMADNNTSAHNFRTVAKKKYLSLHAYGTAIDINPLNNPFIDFSCSSKNGTVTFKPPQGIRYANRRENRLGKKTRIGMAEQALDVFSRHGFYWWGGYWDCPIDYQHFQVSRSVSELLVTMKESEAKYFFSMLVKYFNKYKKPIENKLKIIFGNQRLKDVYLEDSQKFFETLQSM